MKISCLRPFWGHLLYFVGRHAPLSIFVALGLSVTSEAAHLRQNKYVSDEKFFNFDYSQHGRDWTVGSCSSGGRQSPIDLPSAAALVGEFFFKYSPIIEAFNVINNGRTLAIDVAGQGYGGITYDNAFHHLTNINVHSLSEHTWNGAQKPLELHLVHQRYDGGAYLIVAVALEGTKPVHPVAALSQVNASSKHMLRSAEKQAPLFIPGAPAYVAPASSEANFNPALQTFLEVEPPQPNTRVRVPADGGQSFDFNALINGSQFYEYAGSLTAPPCAEIVTWLVRKDIIKASDRQVQYLNSVITKMTADFGNYRAVMPLDGRRITMRNAMPYVAPPTVAPSNLDASLNKHSNREVRTLKWATDAMTKAGMATNYVKDLDTRLQAAAIAHVNALTPWWLRGSMPGGSSAGTSKAAPAPAAQYMLAPTEWEKIAHTMTRTLSTEAHQEIEDASERVTQQAKEAAMQAARDAAPIVYTPTIQTATR